LRIMRDRTMKERFRYPFELRGFSHPLVDTVRRRIERVPRDQIEKEL
jgi:hypothetical protein